MIFHRARAVSLDSPGACGWALFLPRSSRNYPQICCTPPSMLSRTMLSPVQPDAPRACYNASIPWAVRGSSCLSRAVARGAGADGSAAKGRPETVQDGPHGAAMPCARCLKAIGHCLKSIMRRCKGLSRAVAASRRQGRRHLLQTGIRDGDAARQVLQSEHTILSYSDSRSHHPPNLTMKIQI